MPHRVPCSFHRPTPHQPLPSTGAKIVTPPSPTHAEPTTTNPAHLLLRALQLSAQCRHLSVALRRQLHQPPLQLESLLGHSAQFALSLPHSSIRLGGQRCKLLASACQLSAHPLQLGVLFGRQLRQATLQLASCLLRSPQLLAARCGRCGRLGAQRVQRVQGGGQLLPQAGCRPVALGHQARQAVLQLPGSLLPSLPGGWGGWW